MRRRLTQLLLPLLGLASTGAAHPSAPTRPAALPGPTPAAAPDPGFVGAQADDSIGWPAVIEARLSAVAPPHMPTALRPVTGLAPRLDAIVEAARVATVGAIVRDLDTGRTVYERDAERPLNPASTAKLLTAVAAAELLGADYRFETRVVADGDRLVLIGEGDPSLSVEDLTALADAVAAWASIADIREIVVDDTAFSAARFGPGYDPDGPGVSYMAPSGALSLQWNTVEIVARAGRSGTPVTVTVRPPSAHLRVDNTAVAGRSTAVSIETADADGHTAVMVSGRLRRGQTSVRRRRVADPGLFTGHTFAAALARRIGHPPLPVRRGVAPARAEPGVSLVARHRSKPLAEAMRSALKFSNNFATEQLLRTLAWRASGRPGDWETGRALVRRFWQAMGGAPDALVFVNAAGLSRGSRMTPKTLANLVARTADAGTPASALLPMLPRAGEDGTLRARMRRARGRIRAKTGTLRGAGGLTGIVTSVDGHHRLAFSILINGPISTAASRRLQDRFAMALVAHLDRDRSSSAAH